MRRSALRPLTLLVSSALLLGTLAGCGDGGGDSSTGAGTGTLSLGVTDTPVDDAVHVWVVFAGLELARAGGERVVVDCQTAGFTCDWDVDEDGNADARRIDLLALQGDLRDLLLDNVVLPAGDYPWLRLDVLADVDGSCRDSCIDIQATGEHELRVPSGARSGLKLNTPFEVAQDGAVDYTIHFDLRKSVTLPQGTVGPLGAVYTLRPTLSLMATDATGTLVGTVQAGLLGGPGCSPNGLGDAVYVLPGANPSPDDVDGVPPEPVATGKVVFDGSGHVYEVGFVESGEYTLALTCRADLDEADQDNSAGNAASDPVVSFLSVVTAVPVAAGQTTRQDFPAN